VVRLETAALVGVEASSTRMPPMFLLAAELVPTQLLLLTDVDAVYQGYGTPRSTPAWHT